MRARGRLEARADQWAVESSSTAPPHGVGLVEMKSACFSLPERLPSSAFGTNLPSEIVRPSDARCSASIFDERHLTKAAEPGAAAWRRLRRGAHRCITHCRRPRLIITGHAGCKKDVLQSAMQFC